MSQQIDKTADSTLRVTDDIEDVLKYHYHNYWGKPANKFKEELLKNYEAQRMVRGAGRRSGAYLKVFFQARRAGTEFYYRYVASGKDKAIIIPQSAVDSFKKDQLRHRAEHSYKREIEDLRTMFTAYMEGTEEDNDLGYFNEYGLSFDFVEAGTFTDQLEGYYRYQLSYGGPSEEFRFYTDSQKSLHRIEFWFLDWFVGHEIEVEYNSEDWQLMSEIFSFFTEEI